MAQFSFTDDLITGNALIDGDHRKLITMVNALFDSMAQGHANDIMSKVLNNLIVYTKEHFGREEAEMQRINYAASLSHKSEHTKLIKQVLDLKATVDRGEKINVVTISSFLSNWLREHILTVDMKLATALKQRAQTA
ncbi:MAG: hemerythrin family protein [Burkholderiales bacterium]|nr:hemerythrin family protein [Burkholderiales bacterium]